MLAVGKRVQGEGKNVGQAHEASVAALFSDNGLAAACSAPHGAAQHLVGLGTCVALRSSGRTKQPQDGRPALHVLTATLQLAEILKHKIWEPTGRIQGANEPALASHGWSTRPEPHGHRPREVECSALSTQDRQGVGHRWA